MATHSRRDFLKYTSATLGGMALFPSFVHADTGYRFLSEGQRECLIALCEQIIPRDDAPGATDVGVIHYIEKQISGVFKKHRLSYVEGLISLEAYCQSEKGDTFANLSVELQLDIMTKMDLNQLSKKQWPKGKPATFFKMVVQHTMQGFYGSPIHGGNKDHASFDMLDIGYPLIDE